MHAHSNPMAMPQSLNIASLSVDKSTTTAGTSLNGETPSEPSEPSEPSGDDLFSPSVLDMAHAEEDGEGFAPRVSTEEKFGVTWQEVAVHHALKNDTLKYREDGKADISSASDSLSQALLSKGQEGFGVLRDQLFAETAREHPEWIGPVGIADNSGEGVGYGMASSSCSGSGSSGMSRNT